MPADDDGGGGKAKTGRENGREGQQQQPFHGGARGDGGSGIKMKSWFSLSLCVAMCVRTASDV